MSEAENTDLEAIDSNAEQEGQQQEQEAEEFEITTGDSPSQDAAKSKGNPVIARLITQREKAREESNEKDSENQQLRQQLEQMQAELNVIKSTKLNEAPKWSDYDSDEAYQSAVVEWAQSKNKPQPQANPIEMLTQFQRQQSLDSAINGHYQRAEKLAEQFPDYSAAEEVAIQSLGKALVQDIAAKSEKSAEIMLFFGRNPDRAAQFKHLADTDGTRAAIELGRLEASLTIKPKTKTPPPEPDEALEGGGGGNVQARYERELKKARAAGNTREAINIRKRASAEGVNLD